MRILSQRTYTYVPHFLLCFSYGNEGRGFSFVCDKDGKVDEGKLNVHTLATYKECMSGKVVSSPQRQMRVGADGEYEQAPGCDQQITYKVGKDVRDYGKFHTEPAVGECDRCQRKVHLHGFTNTCECGADYNMSGQRLADRSQWGEETGESLSDILAVDTERYDSYNDYGCP